MIGTVYNSTTMLKQKCRSSKEMMLKNSANRIFSVTPRPTSCPRNVGLMAVPNKKDVRN